LARKLRDTLESFSEVWIDDLLEPGVSFARVINREIMSCDVTFALFCEHGVQSNWVVAESLRAFDRGVLVPIIPMIEGAPVNIEERLIVPFNSLNALQINFSRVELPSQDSEHLKQALNADHHQLLSAPEVLGRQDKLWQAVSVLDREQSPIIIDQRQILNNPRMLLQPNSRLVEYYDVQGLAAAWEGHLRNSAAKISAHVFTGEGGSGKTRLIVEIFDRISVNRVDRYDESFELPWITGFIAAETYENKTSRENTRRLIEHGPDGYNICLSIDNANRRTVPELDYWFDSIVRRPSNRPKLAVLLSSRNLGEWWDFLKSKYGQLLGDEDDVIPEAALGQFDVSVTPILPVNDSGEKIRVLTQFNNSLARSLNEPDLKSVRWTEEELREITSPWGSDMESLALELLIAAILRVSIWKEARDTTEVEPNQSTDSQNNRWERSSVLGRAVDAVVEEWVESLALMASTSRPLDKRALTTSLAKIALLGGLRSLEELGDHLDCPPSITIEEFELWLRGEFGDANYVARPLQPDILAEHHVKTLIEGRQLARFLQSNHDDDALRQILSMLNRASLPVHWPTTDPAGPAKSMVDAMVVALQDQEETIAPEALALALDVAMTETEGCMRHVLSLIVGQSEQAEPRLEGKSGLQQMASEDGITLVSRLDVAGTQRAATHRGSASTHGITNLALSVARKLANHQDQEVQTRIGQTALRLLRYLGSRENTSSIQNSVRMAKDFIDRFENNEVIKEDAADWLKALIEELKLKIRVQI